MKSSINKKVLAKSSWFFLVSFFSIIVLARVIEGQNVTRHSDVETKEANVIQPKPASNNQQNQNVQSGWKIYTNEKYGFSFQYPENWVKDDKEAEEIDLAGTLIAIHINFRDTISQTFFLLEFHLAPDGVKIYQYALAQCDSSKGWYIAGCNHLVIAGSKAVEAITKIDVDAKGHELSPKFRLIIVDFLNKQETNEIQLQFRTPLSSVKESAKFEQLLSSFKFLN